MTPTEDAQPIGEVERLERTSEDRTVYRTAYDALTALPDKP